MTLTAQALLMPDATESPFFRTTSLKVGESHGAPRIWIEGKWVEDAGFTPAAAIDAVIEEGVVTLRLDESGTRRVARKGDKSVIDLNNQDLHRAVGKAERVKVVAKAGVITITPERTERKRLSRTKTQTEGALYAGGGMLSEAARQAGFEPTFGVEIDPGYADLYARNHPRARIFNQSIAEIDLDDLPPVGLLTIGIPCEPFSRARTKDRGDGGRRQRDLVPEAHELGDMTYWALRVIDHLNPETVVVEEAPAFLQSGAGWILRHALSRMGYNVGAGVLDPREYGRLTGRKRTVIVARSGGPVVFPEPQAAVHTVDDILNPIDHPDNKWFSFAAGEKTWLRDHWERQTEKGNGFASQIIRPGATSVGTIKKRYFAGQGDNPVVAHPFLPDSYRWLTLEEVKRLHGVPEHYYLGDAVTRAGEVLGQGVDIEFFRQVITAATRGLGVAPEAAGQRDGTRDRFMGALAPREEETPARPKRPQLNLF